MQAIFDHLAHLPDVFLFVTLYHSNASSMSSRPRSTGFFESRFLVQGRPRAGRLAIYLLRLVRAFSPHQPQQVYFCERRRREQRSRDVTLENPATLK